MEAYCELVKMECIPKISAYEEGKRVGRREVVEWAERNDPNNSFWKSRCWQAKLKEWGIKDG